MSAQPAPSPQCRRALHRAARWTGRVLAVLAVLILAFLLSAWIGSSIPRNSDWQEPETGIPVMIESNGIHTGIVMPIRSPIKDWTTTFPSAGQPRADGYMPSHIAVGWGEKEVFLNTPTWSDLEISTVMRVVTTGGEGLLRVGHYVKPRAGEDHRWITLRREEYARLVERIEATLPKLAPGEKRKTYIGFEKGAANFDAAGRYTLANTCNQWTADTLAHAGVKIGTWTPLAGGVMKWIPEAD